MKYLLVTAVFIASTWVARGESLSFSAITSNDTGGYAQSVGESQLFMDVVSLGSGQASLVFTNAGPEDSFISSIYFDFFPELSLSLAAINNGNGVEFQSFHVQPKNLPAGKRLDNVFISDLGVAARYPSSKKGINPYESLELIMNYDGSYDLLDALGNEELRIGLHVQGFAGDYSESFISVPEPSSIPLLLVGGFALRRLLIRKSRRLDSVPSPAKHMPGKSSPTFPIPRLDF